MERFLLPNNTQRTAVLGRTGSGKTHFSAWLLSLMNYDKQPWFVVDIKEDRLLGKIEQAKEISITEKKLPREPGIYITHPMPHQTEEMSDFMWKIWEKQRSGLYVDESYLLPNSDSLRALLVTGRSRRIPMIMVSQRPVDVPRAVFTEADFYAIFHLNDKRDKKTVNEFYPGDLDEDLPEYNARWYQVYNNAQFRLTPAQEEDKILDRFDRRLKDSDKWNGFI